MPPPASLLSAGPWSHDCAAHQKDLRRWLSVLIPPLLRRGESERRFPRELLSQLADAGSFRSRWRGDSSHGDLGRSVLLMYELGYQCAAGLAIGVNIHLEGVTSVLRRTKPQVAGVDLLEEALTGRRIGCMAATEPQSGSDFLALSTEARRDGDGWVLNGHKKLISLASTADFALTLARTGEPGDLTFFAVPREGGYRVIRELDKLGTRSVETTELAYEWVRVPESARVGPLHGGFRLFLDAMVAERLGGVALCLGLFRASIEIARGYLSERRGRDGPLWRHQALRHRMADLMAEHDLLWRASWMTAWELQHGHTDYRGVAALKLLAGKRIEAGVSEALQMLGGVGYLADYPLERNLRDVRLLRIATGTDEVLRELLSLRVADEAYDLLRPDR